MFIEIQKNKQGIACAMVQCHIQVGKKNKVHTLENLGPESAIDHKVIDRLNRLCSEGSISAIRHTILNQDLKLKKALLASKGHSAALKSELYELLENPRSNLTYQEQLQIASCFISEDKSIDELVISGMLYNELEADLQLKPKYQFCLREGIIDAVVVAAGIGSRMGSKVPKQYLKLGDKTILEHTVLKLLSCPYVRQVILVLNEQDKHFKSTCLEGLNRLTLVTGGAERVDSVLQGLSAVQSKWCLVHDAARPLVSLDDMENLIFKVAQGVAQGYCGGILACKVADTLKQQSNPNENLSGAFALPTVEKTIDRAWLYRAQTPQLFNTAELSYAIKRTLQMRGSLTDEASALETVGRKVLLVEGSACNFKLTEPSDLVMAQALLNI